MQFPMFLVLASGSLFAASTLVGRWSGASPSFLTLIVLVGSAMCALPVFFFTPTPSVGPTARMVSLGLLSGILNGVGVIMLYRLIGGSGPATWQLSTVVPGSVIIMCLGTMLGSWLFFHEALTWQRAGGVALACVAIWLLR